MIKYYANIAIIYFLPPPTQLLKNTNELKEIACGVFLVFEYGW